jgi:hypothetical protein
MLVEDEGPRRPIVAQCAGCGDLTGVARVSSQLDLADAGPVAGSPEDLGF